MLSNSPEQVTGPGLLYRGTVAAGLTRLMLYHANFAASDLRLSVVVEPADSTTPPTVTLRRSVRHGPSLDYLQVGRRAALDFLALPDNPQEAVAGEPVVLDPALDQLSGFRGQALIIAHHDLEVADGPLRFTVLAREPQRDPREAVNTLPFLAREPDGSGGFKHDRGTFSDNADKEISNLAHPYSTASGMARLRMANSLADVTPLPDVDRDAWAGEDGEGVDQVLNVSSRVAGNYGVMYTVRFGWQSPDGRRVAVLLNPRAGSYAGAIGELLDTGEVQAAFTPPDPPKSVSASTSATLLGTWDPSERAQVTLRWTPAGASNFPVEWLLVPF